MVPAFAAAAARAAPSSRVTPPVGIAAAEGSPRVPRSGPSALFTISAATAPAVAAAFCFSANEQAPREISTTLPLTSCGA